LLVKRPSNVAATAVYFERFFIAASGLISYGPDFESTSTHKTATGLGVEIPLLGRADKVIE